MWHVSFMLAAPGSLRPLRTVRATFTAYGSGTFKAHPVKGNPAVITLFIGHKKPRAKNQGNRF